MKKKIIIYGIIIAGILLAGYFFMSGDESKDSKYTFAEVTRGNLNVLISSSGSLEAITTVEVGTQVSGRIAKLYADFNSEVKKGQLLAILDTVTLAATVRDQQANLEKARAQYNQMKAVHERNKKLYEKNFISELDFIESQTNVESAIASLKSAESALERAKTNLEYAFIYAPISGKVINRSVEEGQTVAASLSAPTLFTIAEDLSSMRILASVDESDIGQIKEGQKVKFTVQTYSDKTFDGVVAQIRLKPTVASNVVNYTVVVNADNEEKLLLPGMTATVDFYVDYRENVLTVPNGVLRLQATDEMTEELKKNMEEEIAKMPDSLKNKFESRRGKFMSGGMGMNGGNSNGKKSNVSRIWYLDEKGKLKMNPVMIGLTDGKNTEIVRGRNIKEGMKIISGVVEVSAATTKSSNPLTGTQSNQPRVMIGPGPL